MNYKILLFDLDDTLLDFGANEMDSLRTLFAQHGYDFTEELFNEYSSINKQLWTDYELGNISLDEVLSTRFAKTMSKSGKIVDGPAWEAQYRELLGNGHQLIDGAVEVCTRLSETHRLFVVTNGITKTQLKRLEMSGLDKFFEDVFTSENIGYQKPVKEFFDYVAGNVEDFSKEQTLLIGDSLSTDIKGGFMYGIDTCWLNTRGKSNNEDFESTYTITALEEIYKCL